MLLVADESRVIQFPWKELDREEEALAEDPCSGLGFNKKGERIDWHGGQVVFTGRLQDKSCKKYKTPPIYKIVLEQPRLGPSTMFSRRFGSKHFFRVKMPNSLNKNPDKLTQFFQRPLFLCGFVFRAFYAKESNVFYVKTNEVTDGSRILPGETIPGLMSFLDFLDWHNPMKLNSNQVDISLFLLYSNNELTIEPAENG
jgi:RNA-dependent RNA polymerase